MLVMLLLFVKKSKNQLRIQNSSEVLLHQRAEVDWVDVNTDKKEGVPTSAFLIVQTFQPEINENLDRRTLLEVIRV